MSNTERPLSSDDIWADDNMFFPAEAPLPTTLPQGQRIHMYADRPHYRRVAFLAHLFRVRVWTMHLVLLNLGLRDFHMQLSRVYRLAAAKAPPATPRSELQELAIRLQRAALFDRRTIPRPGPTPDRTVFTAKCFHCLSYQRMVDVELGVLRSRRHHRPWVLLKGHCELCGTRTIRRTSQATYEQECGRLAQELLDQLKRPSAFPPPAAAD